MRPILSRRFLTVWSAGTIVETTTGLPVNAALSNADACSLKKPDLKELGKLLVPRMLPEFMPHAPLAPQAAFLLYDGREALYGGAAGGGKSDALLMAALQYVDVPGYAALILRNTFQQLTLNEGLMNRAAEWLGGTAAKWIADEKTWAFPTSGKLPATVTFGFLETEQDKYRYQGAAFQCICLDELTQFKKSQYLYMFSRLRRLKEMAVPVRMRASANPGGVGHEWVKERFIDNPKDRIFVPAKIDDNRYLDKNEYVQSLNELSPIERRQLLHGDWNARPDGTFFLAKWYENAVVYAADLPPIIRSVRIWDFGATAAGVTQKKKQGDPTVGLKAVRGKDKTVYIVDARRQWLGPKGVEDLVRRTALVDGIGTKIIIEQEGGASGAMVIDHYKRVVLPEFVVEGVSPRKSKGTRALASSAYTEAGLLKLLKGDWNEEYVDEHAAFTGDADEHDHDEYVDTTAYALDELTKGRQVVWELY